MTGTDTPDGRSAALLSEANILARTISGLPHQAARVLEQLRTDVAGLVRVPPPHRPAVEQEARSRASRALARLEATAEKHAAAANKMLRNTRATRLDPATALLNEVRALRVGQDLRDRLRGETSSSSARTEVLDALARADKEQDDAAFVGIREAGSAFLRGSGWGADGLAVEHQAAALEAARKPYLATADTVEQQLQQRIGRAMAAVQQAHKELDDQAHWQHLVAADPTDPDIPLAEPEVSPDTYLGPAPAMVE